MRVMSARRRPSRTADALDPPEHVATYAAVLPGARVAVAVEEEADGECAERGNLRVGQGDYRSVAAPQHRDHHRKRDVEAPVADSGVEAPVVSVELCDA